MKPFGEINFLPRSQSVWLPQGIAGALLIGACGLLFDAWQMDAACRQRREQQADLDFQRKLREQKSALNTAQQDQRLRALDELVKPGIQAAAFPWDELLVSLERLKVPGVRLMSLSVDSQQGIARVGIECADPVQATEVVDWLEAGQSRSNRRWRLGRMQRKPEAAAKFEAELQYIAAYRL